jgi:hypothetical protein
MPASIDTAALNSSAKASMMADTGGASGSLSSAVIKIAAGCARGFGIFPKGRVRRELQQPLVSMNARCDA